MKSHSIYDENSGEIVGVLSCPDEMFSVAASGILSGHAVLEGVFVDGDAYYYDLINTIRPRPEITTEPSKIVMSDDGIDSIILAGLPIPCTVTVDDVAYIVDDCEFEFTTDTAGVYKILVEAFPHIPKSWEVTAV